MKVAEVCGEEVKSITQHQAKRLPISVINFMLPISVAKREQGMDICKIILRFWLGRKPWDIKKDLISGDLGCLQDSWFREECKSRGALYEGTGFFNIRDTDEKSLHTFSWNFAKAFKIIRKSKGLDSQTRKNKLVLFNFCCWNPSFPCFLPFFLVQPCASRVHCSLTIITFANPEHILSISKGLT